MKEHTVDRSTWGTGPWDNEPDRLEWRDEMTGLPCLIVRNYSLCGYVGVPPGHPWHGKDWDAIGADVHGGITYADGCREDSPICHVPLPGEPDDVWWLGFDTNHSGDYNPGGYQFKFPGDVYRDLAYVRAEVVSLAAQIHEARNEGLSE